MIGRHWPNTLTGLRIALLPVLAWLLLQRAFAAAALLVTLAAITDLLDGLLARRYGWQSRLGGLLDPIADKLLLATCFVGLWLTTRAVPVWLLLLVLVRDVVIVTGAIAYHRWIGRLDAEPSWLGKLTTPIQLAFVLAVLLAEHHAMHDPMALWIGWAAVAGVTLFSGIDYVSTWGRRAWRARPSHRE